VQKKNFQPFILAPNKKSSHFIVPFVPVFFHVFPLVSEPFILLWYRLLCLFWCQTLSWFINHHFTTVSTSRWTLNVAVKIWLQH